MKFLQDMVKQEKIAWVTVLFSLAIAVFYFGNVPLALEAQDLHSREMRRIVLICFLLITAAEIAVAFAGISKSGLTEEDERDQRINDKAVSIAYRTMLGFVVLLIGHIVFFQGITSFIDQEALTKAPILGELGIANVLLGILIVTSIAHQVAKIIFYRRGY